MLAQREISESEYRTWSNGYQTACMAIQNRPERIEASVAQIERDFELLGATAIEDRLQDGVP